MTELQTVEFDMLKQIAAVCEKLGVRFYLLCGSALGAVKYGGFIPWDDDIDIGMLRSDYELFISKAQELLPKHLFLQTFRTDKGYSNIFAKLRNSNTTMIESSASGLRINHGAYIDIFPLDGYPKEKRKQNGFERCKRLFLKLLSCNYSVKRQGFSRVSNRLMRMLGIHHASRIILTKYESMLLKYPTESSEIICNHGNWQGRLEYFPSTLYGEGKAVDFEGRSFLVPFDIDTYLSTKYGDWREEPEEEKRKSHHIYDVIDTTLPYTSYTNGRTH